MQGCSRSARVNESCGMRHMKNYNAVLTLVSDINKVFAHVTEDEDKIEPSDLIVLNKYMYRFINSIEVQP